jgi:hypothetical protein
MPQLIEKNIIDASIWSLLLVNGKDGIFSIGGTSSPSLRQAEIETDDALAQLGTNELKGDGVVGPRSSPATKSDAVILSNEWRWSEVQGAEGWWQILMRGIWVDGVRVLNNQPIVLDVSIFQICKDRNLIQLRSTHPSS